MSEKKIAWMSDGHGFGTATDQDDFYHGRGLKDKHFTTTETWYWGFYEAKSNLHGFIHIWMHPHLGLCTAGIFAHFGHKRDHLAAEVYDFQVYMPDSIFDEQGNIETANGLKVEFEWPMKKMRIRYANPGRGFSLDMVQEAVQPAVMRSNNQHFEQVMRSRGAVHYQGAEYPFDNLSIRDRSWGEQRHEDGHLLPPYTWMNGTFSERVAFTIGAFDDPKLHPNWEGLYTLSDDQLVTDAWIFDHGKTLKVTAVSKLTQRAEDGLRPVRHVIQCTTEDGREYQFNGEVLASNPWHCWQNALCHCGLTRWTSPQLDGEGWGETQEVQWNDYVARLCPPV